MKSNRGVTITSLIIYVIAFTIIISIITTISTYFYKNLSNSSTSKEYKEYAKFNSYFVKEVNMESNDISDASENYVIFSDGNQFVYQENSIYLNKVKICKNIKNCTFTVLTENNKTIIEVKIKIEEKEFDTKYTMLD